MALVQQRMEKTTNWYRDNAISFKIRDKVWLDLSKIKIIRIYKKLNTKYTKYTIVKVIGLYIYCLDILLDIHFVQFIKRLYLAVTNLLSEQQLTIAQSLKVIAIIKKEYKVEKILNEKIKRKKEKQYLIK